MNKWLTRFRIRSGFGHSAWTALIAVAAALATLDIASAQEPPPLPENCASCRSCEECVRSSWGALFCDFGGGCCRHRGGICNPSQAMNVAAHDRRFIPAEGDREGVLVVRLEGAVFGTWACEDGVLREAYRELGDGTLHSLSEPELEEFRRRYPLDRYTNLLSDRLIAAAAEAG